MKAHNNRHGVGIPKGTTIKKKSTLTTTIQEGAPGKFSTTIPQAIIHFAKLKKGDKIEWDVRELPGGKIEIVAVKEE